MELKRAKGTRDFLSEEMILRLDVEDSIRNIFELYGFSPVETPVLENSDMLTAKFGGGEEIIKEMFTLKDQGERNLGLRYDFTVPLARLVAMNPQLKLPFKRYQIGKNFRDGPIKPGRYREFTQCDVDIVGVLSVKADAELANIAVAVFKELKIPAVVKINNRKVLNAILEEVGVKKSQWTSVILTIDKLAKLGLPSVKKELQDKGIETKAITKIIKLITVKGTNKEKVKQLKAALKNKEGIREVEEFLSFAPRVEFDCSLARGLAYYTRTVMEAFALESKISSSIGGGGRYDDMIGSFKGNVSCPATGFSFGLDIIVEVLKEFKKDLKKSVTEVFVIPIKTFKESLKVAQELRSNGINSEIDLMDKNISKNLDYANKKAIPFVVFIGNDELKRERVKLRNMKSGKEELVTVKELIKRVKKGC